MMKGLMVLVSVLLLYLGFVFWQNLVEPNMEAPVRTTVATAPATAIPLDTPAPPLATPAPVPVATPRPIIPQAQVTDASPTPRPNLAPPGTYFLTERISVMTDSGVMGDPPGTLVTLVSAGPAMRVTDGKNEFEVRSSQVTNDYNVAMMAANADRDALSSAGAFNAREAEAADKQRSAAQAAWDQKEHALGSAYPEPLPMTMGELNQPPKPVSLINGGGTYRSAVH
jgi:hypothetical protein